MKIRYHAVIGIDGKISKVRAEKLDFCCDEMKVAVEQEFVAMTDLDHYGFAWVEAKVCFISQSNYPEGSHRDYLKLSYCPWCREEITTEETGRSQLVERKVPATKVVTEEVPISPAPKQ